jgi:hypothetical protein
MSKLTKNTFLNKLEANVKVTRGQCQKILACTVLHSPTAEGLELLAFFVHHNAAKPYPTPMVWSPNIDFLSPKP